MLRNFGGSIRSNLQKATQILARNNSRIDADSVEKQISVAVANGELPTYEKSVEELKAKTTPVDSRIKLRKTKNDYSFYMQSFGYMRELSKNSKELPDPTSAGYDEYLQTIWIKEPILAGAVYSMAAKMTALNWQVTGLRDEAMAASQLLARAAYATDGYDWGGFIASVSQDFYTTNKGTFWETAKQGNPLYGELKDIAHIDSLTCTLTGNAKAPMIYRSDVTGQILKFKPGQFIHYASMPSPREERFGAGMCAVSRALRAAHLLMGLHDYDIEKLDNLPPEGVASVTGLTTDEFKTAITLWQMEREKNNSLTFPQVLWLIGSQPNIEVKLDFIGFSQLPESFDREAVVTQYINTLALDFGVDAREFWPISTSSLGTAAESEIQHMKAKGKGPGELISLTERKINGELPEGVHFEFDTQDIQEDLKAAETAKAWIEAYMPLLTGSADGGGQPGAEGAPAPAAEPLVPKEDILRILADHGVIPNSIVGDDREVIHDNTIHIKENSAPASSFHWQKGILIEKILPPIIFSGSSRYSKDPNIPIAERLKGDTKLELTDDFSAIDVEEKEFPFPEYKEELERNIKGQPIPQKEVSRGASVTQTAIKDELALWRTVGDLNLYAIEEDEQSDYVKRTNKK